MRSIVAVLLAAVCFGTTGTAAALLANTSTDDASALSLGAARIVIGGGALALIAFVVARRRGARTSSPAAGALRRLPSWLIIGIGAAGIVAYQPAFFAGTAANGVAVGTVVALGSAPVITGALDWVVHRRFPGGVWLVATLIATIGVAVLGFADGTAPGGADPLGLLASLGAGASYAVYTLASKELLDRGASPTGAMGALFGTAAVASLPLLLSTDLGWLAHPAGIATALWLGLVTTTLAYVLFARGLAGLRASTVATLTLAEPLTASILGLAVLHEPLSAGATLGLAILAGGIVVLTVGSRPRRPVNA
ncbi:DMT family transporter [Agromyces atrinae]|uniref:DMT family transporter n=1 Tax=Agromyces atrinae TaxID=592376 RepID=UPI001F596B08|nr:EamA family transporter [Agromyces atrinae]MCI2956160.1 DMT family transporter [Agromyces atrinae]